MTSSRTLTVRLVTLDELDSYLLLSEAIAAGSGVDGEAHSHAYSQSEPFDFDAGHRREVIRWSTEADSVGYRRVWRLFDRDQIVGYLHLAGGGLRSELHRAELGMGVAHSYRRQGGGRLLMTTAIEWARNQRNIAWIDLGVFSDNPGAQRLYEAHGFQVVGRTADRFRVNGQSLDEIEMTLNVAQI